MTSHSGSQHLGRVKLDRKGVVVRAVLGNDEVIRLAQRSRAGVAQQRRYEPRERRADRTHRVLRQRIELRQLCPFFELGGERARRARQNELFPRAGHCDIEHAQLLGHHLAALLHRDRCLLDRFILHAALQIAAAAAEAKLLMDEHRLVQVFLVEVLRAVRHDNDRKLQSL